MPQEGDTCVVDWDGYTIGYYGRPFEARNKVGEEGDIWGGGKGGGTPSPLMYSFRHVASQPSTRLRLWLLPHACSQRAAASQGRTRTSIDSRWASTPSSLGLRRRSPP